jgi:hypothetical protein
MDIVFQNITDITNVELSEFSKNYNAYNKNMRITILIAFLDSIFLIVLGLNRKIYEVCLVGSIMALFFIFICFKGYIFKAKQNYKNMQALYENQPQFIHTFFEDSLESVATNLNSKVDYSQITGLIETKNLYILVMEKQALMLNKNSFTVGHAKAFKSFIFKKCKSLHK